MTYIEKSYKSLDKLKNKPKMAYSRDAFFRDLQETRERQDQSEIRERFERDWREAYHRLISYGI